MNGGRDDEIDKGMEMPRKRRAETGRGGGVRTWTQREGNGGPERGGWRPREREGQNQR